MDKSRFLAVAFGLATAVADRALAREKSRLAGNSTDMHSSSVAIEQFNMGAQPSTAGKPVVQIVPNTPWGIARKGGKGGKSGKSGRFDLALRHDLVRRTVALVRPQAIATRRTGVPAAARVPQRDAELRRPICDSVTPGAWGTWQAAGTGIRAGQAWRTVFER